MLFQELSPGEIRISRKSCFHPDFRLEHVKRHALSHLQQCSIVGQKRGGMAAVRRFDKLLIIAIRAFRKIRRALRIKLHPLDERPERLVPWLMRW